MGSKEKMLNVFDLLQLIMLKMESTIFLPTSNPHVVEALLWVGILTLIVSRRVYCLVFSANLENAPRYTHLRWATIFAEKSHRLLDAVLDYAEILLRFTRRCFI